MNSTYRPVYKWGDYQMTPEWGGWDLPVVSGNAGVIRANLPPNDHHDDA